MFFKVKSFEKAELFLFWDEFIRVSLRHRANVKVKLTLFGPKRPIPLLENEYTFDNLLLINLSAANYKGPCARSHPVFSNGVLNNLNSLSIVPRDCSIYF